MARHNIMEADGLVKTPEIIKLGGSHEVSRNQLTAHGHLRMPQEKELDSKLYVEAAEARRFVESILRGNGVGAENAAIVARCLVAADLRGVDTHG